MTMKSSRHWNPLPRILPVVAAALVAACSGGGEDGAPSLLVPPPTAVSATVTLTWAANPDTEVNKAGGGYRVYYSRNSGFQPGDPGVRMVDVPYAGGAAAPTTAGLPVDTSGLWYFRVQAYSALNPGGSPLSAPMAVLVPAS